MATKQKINLSVPGSTAITDGKGVLKQEWRLWFNKIYQRLGGDAAYSNTDLEDFIININSQVDTINTTITTLQTELNNVSDEITLIQNNITIINDNITILQNNITDIQNNITTIDNSINTINTSLATINTTLTSLQSQITTNTNDIATLNSSVIKTIASVGAGISIFLSKVGNTANLKSLKAGTNITLDNTTDPNEIVINASGGSNTVIDGTSMSFAVNYDITTGGNYNFILANSNLPVNSLSGSSDNIYMGYKVGLNNIAPNYNILIGNRSGQFTAINYCTAIGHDTLNRGADNNIAIGLFALNNVNTQQNIAIGQYALSYQRYSNCIGIGYGVTVTGNNQIQLGDSSTTVYCYGPVQDRSDARDKIDIQDSDHGLNFIMQLRARKWRWNHRERYSTPAMDENGKYYRKEVPNDGSRAGKRYHYGLIAQEVQDILIKNNIDFGGFQDHNINNGEDVMSIGYNELISPMIKAIQEQQLIILQLQEDIKILKGKSNG